MNNFENNISYQIYDKIFLKYLTNYTNISREKRSDLVLHNLVSETRKCEERFESKIRVKKYMRNKIHKAHHTGRPLTSLIRSSILSIAFIVVIS